MDLPENLVGATAFALRDGESVVVRPIRPDDAPRLQALAPRLSPATIHARFFGSRRELRPAEAARLARVDGRDRMAFVAERATPDRPEVIGVARYDRAVPGDADAAEFAILVEDRFQHEGLGQVLLRRLVEVARHHGIRRLVGDVLADNQPMLHFLRSASFPMTLGGRGPEVRFAWEIAPDTEGAR